VYTLKVQPEGGSLYELTHDYDEFIITRIDGLCPPMNSVNISGNGVQDGGTFNSARLGSRNLVLNITLRGDIDASRRKLYGLFPQKGKVTIFFQDGVRHMKTVGYVEQPDCCPFDFPSKVMVSVICPDPYWYDVTEIEETFAAFEAVTIDNTGDAPAGFRCVVEFTAGSTPTVTLGEASDTLDAAYPYTRNMFLNPYEGGVPVSFDPATQKIAELMVASTDITDKISDVDEVIKEDDLNGTNAENYIHVAFSSDVLAAGTYPIDYAIIGIDNGSAENVECYVHTSTDFSNSITPSIYNCNINFEDVVPGTDYDSNTDVARLYLRNLSGWVLQNPENYTLESGTTSTGGHFIFASFGYNLIGAGYTAGKLVVYHDTTGADIRSTLQYASYHGTRNVSQDWSANCYDSIPAGYNSAKDVPYINGIRITAAGITECYLIPSGGSAQGYSIVYGDPGSTVDFRYVYSLNGDDIREYTDNQIDAGLSGTAFTEKLCIWNNTTGEWLQFKNTRFQLGDVLEVSTVPGDLYAKITERDGEDVDISILYDCYRNGTFFRLKAGENEIEITAESGSEYVSATMTAELLYTGV